MPQNNINLCVTNKLTKYLIGEGKSPREGFASSVQLGPWALGWSHAAGTGFSGEASYPLCLSSLPACCASPHRFRRRSYDRLNCPCGLAQDSSFYRHNIGIRNDAALGPNPRPRPTKLYPPSYSPRCDWSWSWFLVSVSVPSAHEHKGTTELGTARVTAGYSYGFVSAHHSSPPPCCAIILFP